LIIQAPVGASVEAGDILAVVHARSTELADRVAPRLQKAWRMSEDPVRRPPHVLARVDRNGISKDG
jgi:thymidine phosphorylase